MIQLLQRRQSLDVFQFIVAEIQAAKSGEVLETFDVLDEVIVEFQLFEGRYACVGEFDTLDLVLAKAYAFEPFEAFEA